MGDRDRIILFVGGTWDNNGGRQSKITSDILLGIHEAYYKIANIHVHNGGMLSNLERILNSIPAFDIVIWMPNISNDVEEKFIHRIKQENKKCILVSSKRNIENEYPFEEIVNHALKRKSNLILEFSKHNDIYEGRIFDPLGNMFLDYENDFTTVGAVMTNRALQLAKFTRVASTSLTAKNAGVPNDKAFFEIVKKSATVFDKLMHQPANPSRFLGNASFRCQRGFPSFRDDNNNAIIYVSRRNVDKKFISKEAFVPVVSQDTHGVIYFYYGDHKPSVDTPIQRSLYLLFPRVNYMIHGHAYVDNAPFTDEVVPCGAIEEITEISRVFNNIDQTNFAINLLGHGSIVLASDLKFFNEITYSARPFPEQHFV